MSNTFDTFCAAISSVGTAATLASSGFYLHRRGIIPDQAKKNLALFSKHVFIPALFFSKIVHCPQNFTSEECPNVIDHLSDTWILLFWPLFVVGFGLIIGEMVVRLTNTPPRQRRMVLASCALANSTGLPLTLLTVVHDNFPPTSELANVDPSIFLSVYLVLYPMLQWCIGGWLLAPKETDTTTIMTVTPRTSIKSTHSDEDMELAENPINNINGSPKSPARASIKSISTTGGSSSSIPEDGPRPRRSLNLPTGSIGSILEGTTSQGGYEKVDQEDNLMIENAAAASVEFTTTEQQQQQTENANVSTFQESAQTFLSQALQPPVIAALLGLLVASIRPLRGIFVDVNDRDHDALLEWVFDGLYTMGKAAVPVNMAILGINLSTSLRKGHAQDDVLSYSTIFGVVFGKLIAMPIIGIVTTWLLKEYFWRLEEKMYALFYMVLILVTATPTANNVMVMAELSGCCSKDGMAKLMGFQYAFTPLLLSITVAMATRIAGLEEK